MRVLVAARLSKLADGQTGLDTQDREATAWAGREGHTVVQVAADRKSGTSAPWDRKNLKPWVTDPDKLAQYDAVLAYRLDRLSRGNQESTSAIEDWARKNSKMLLTTDGLVFPCEGTDGIRWDLAKRLAHAEWLGCSEKYSRMTAYLRSVGKLSSRPPFGYRSAPAEDGQHKIMVPTSDGLTYVPEMFTRCAAGESLAAIAAWLNEAGIRTTSGYLWHPVTVGRVIKNSAYTGKVRTESGQVILRCEALIDGRTFRLANEALTRRPKRGPQTDHRAMLTSCLFCLRCGGPMYRRTTKGCYLYYRCAGSGPSATRRSCGNMVRLETLDAIVSARIDRMTAHIFETRVIPGHDHSAELEEIKTEMRDLAAQDLSDDEYDARLAGLRTERDRLAALAVVPDDIQLVDTGISYAAMWSSLGDSERGAWLRSAGIKVFALKGTQDDVDAIAARGGMFGPEDAPPEVVDGVALFIPMTLGFPLTRTPLPRRRG